MCAELFVQLPMISLREQVEVERPKHGAERIRVSLGPLAAVVARKFEAVAKPFLCPVERRFEEAFAMDTKCRPSPLWIVHVKYFERLHPRPQGSHDEPVILLMHAEHRKWVVVIRTKDCP